MTRVFLQCVVLQVTVMDAAGLVVSGIAVVGSEAPGSAGVGPGAGTTQEPVTVEQTCVSLYDLSIIMRALSRPRVLSHTFHA